MSLGMSEQIFRESDFRGIPELRAALRSAARRSQAAVSQAGDTLYVFSHETARRALAHPALRGKGAALFEYLSVGEGTLRRWYESLMITNDGPAHSRMKGIVGRDFTPFAVERYRAMAAALIADGLREVLEQRGGDLVNALRHVSIRLMASIVGAPDEDVPMILGWVQDLEGFSVMGGDRFEQADAAIASLLRYTDALCGLRLRSPRA